MEHCALFGTLKYYNFVPKTINWIKLLFTNFYVCTINSGEISEWFLLTRGLYQGNPLSSTVFILIVDIMGHLIRENSKIRGIQLGNYEFKITQFVDDTNLFLNHDMETLQQTLHTLILFERNYGLKLNYDKSNVYRIGSLKNSNARMYTIKTLMWTNDPIKVLGTNIYGKREELIERNY